jgi:hypothetical protein
MAFEFLARLTESGIHVMLIETARTKKRQEKLIAEDRSWTMLSSHCVTRPDGEPAARALDVAPWAVFSLYGADKLLWDADAPIWRKIGLIGKEVGFRWGGDWRRKDMGHFEI